MKESKSTPDYKTVVEYQALQQEEIRIKLQQIREIIRAAAPEAEEKISYQMPSFSFQGMLIWYAVFKNHFGLYLRPRVLNAFRKKFPAFEQTKSAIRIPLDHPLPETLITEIV